MSDDGASIFHQDDVHMGLFCNEMVCWSLISKAMNIAGLPSGQRQMTRSVGERGRVDFQAFILEISWAKVHQSECNTDGSLLALGYR